MAEQFRVGDSGGIAPGMGETSPGARFKGFMIGAVPGDRQLRIDKKAFRAGFGIRERMMVNIVADGFAQRRDRGFITRFQLGKRLFRGQTAALLFMIRSLFQVC